MLVEFLGEETERAKCCEGLTKDLYGALGMRCEVEALPKGAVKSMVDTEKRTKYKRIIDLRK